MKESSRGGRRISREMTAIVSVGVALAALNVVTIAELREQGRTDRAACTRESGETRSDRDDFAREIARLTREGRYGTRRCRLTLEEVTEGIRCPQ